MLRRMYDKTRGNNIINNNIKKTNEITHMK